MERKLYRSRKDRIIGGVCGGIANYFDIDPTLVRLAFIFILLFRGAGLLGYIIAWFIIPERPINDEILNEIEKRDNEEDSQEKEDAEDEREDNQKFFGVILVVLGGIFLADIWLPFFYWKNLWAILLVGLGVSIIWKEVRKSD